MCVGCAFFQRLPGPDRERPNNCRYGIGKWSGGAPSWRYFHARFAEALGLRDGAQVGAIDKTMDKAVDITISN
jgi:hypothetical protein